MGWGLFSISSFRSHLLSIVIGEIIHKSSHKRRAKDPPNRTKVKVIILDIAQLKTFWTNPNVFSSKVNKKTPRIFEFKLQTLFSTILIVLISLTIISLVTIQSKAQPVLSRQQEKLLDNSIAFSLLDSFEYTLEVNGTQIFPNDTVKNSVVNEYTPSVYNIPSIQYEIMGHTINASDVQIHVYPTKIDEVNTRLDFQIFANNAEVRGPSLNNSYDSLDISSAYGIYNQATDKMTIHMPYSAAVQHLLQ